MSDVLVTGASGFVGFHLVRALRQRGVQVDCLVRRTSKVAHLEALGVGYIYGDVTDPTSLPAAVTGKSVVYHLAGCTAALRREEFYAINEAGTRHLAEACARQSRPPVLVVVSSLAAAGPSPFGRLRTEDDPLAPVSEYGRSKRAAELAAQQFADRVPMTVLRPPIVLGERDAKGAAIFRAIRRLGVHAIPGMAPHRFSILHAADLAEALILAAARGKRLRPGGPSGGNPGDTTGFYFIACDEHPTYVELGRMIRAEVGRPRALILRVPVPIVWVVGACSELAGRWCGKPLALNLDKVREATAGSWTCSSARAAAELGFRVTTPLAERLRQTAQWYRHEGWL